MKKVLGVVVSLIVLGFLVSCGTDGAQIVRITPDKSELVPGESTILRSEIDNPEASELEYAWETDAGTIENLGDSARWTAPDFLWTDSTVEITLTVEDTGGTTDNESVSIQVTVERHDVQASEDTYTFSYVPDNSYEDGEFLRVGYDESWGSEEAFFHTFMKFPTPAVPAGETLHGARLKLYREYGEGEEIEIEIYLPRDNWNADGLTWNTEPDADDFAMISDTTTEVGGFYIALTSLVEDWVGGTRENYGLMLRVSDETDYTHRFRDYGAMEGVQAKRPVLEIVSW